MHKKPRLMLDEATPLGEPLTFEQFRRVSHQRIWDGLVYSGACGASGVIFRRPDGTIGLDDCSAIYIEGEE